MRPERTERRNTHLALVLTAIAGTLNSVGFVAVATYTSHMTGIVASMADTAALHAPGLVGTGLLAEHVRDAHRPLVVVAVLCFTMGLQNALITRIGAWPIRTTHVTGMVTDIGVELGKILYRNAPAAVAPVVGEPRRVGLLALLVALFFLGGVAGAAGYLRLGFEVVIPVAGVLLLLAHRPLVQDLQDAWLTRRPRRR